MLKTGTQLGHYEIREPLGSGGMGSVYRAWDQTLKREVAVKVISDHLLEDTDAKARFEREARAIAALSHRNILTIHDFGVEGEIEYAVTELLEGQTVAERLARSGAMASLDAETIALEAARGLAAAHARGIIHRDIKPANLFLTTDGQVKLLDFGLARSITPPTPENSKQTERPTTPGTVLGTVGYMSPEQARGEEATTASDVFSLGCVIYEMVSGHPPFERSSAGETLAAILTEKPPLLSSPASDVSGQLQRILSRCLARDPQQRYSSAIELKTDLEQLVGSATESQALSSTRTRAALAAAIVAPIVVLVTWLSISRGDSQAEHARRVELPQLLELAAEERFYEAFSLARDLDQVIAEDPLLAQAWDDISERATWETNPPGAEIELRPALGEGEWLSVGTTPLIEVRFPHGVHRWRVSRPGSYTHELVAMAPWLFPWSLIEEERVPDDMVWVWGGRRSSLNLNRMPPERGSLPNFLIGKFEVTNRDFKQFVEAGGYRESRYWKHPFVEGVESLSWEEAMQRFHDLTGKPGPATWELGTYPPGEGLFPVRGVSWYEAAAYADFAEAELPTVFHWTQAALGLPFIEAIVAESNFNGLGPAPAGRFPAITVWGAYDMAGNVREWCHNRDGALRYSLGGSWKDQSYSFHQALSLPPLDRSPVNGFRIVRNQGPSGDYDPYRELTQTLRDLDDSRQPGPELVDIWRRMVAYDERPLEVRSEEVSPALQAWSPPPGEGSFRVEKVSFLAAYDSDRMSAHLFLPDELEPPFQPVLYFPGEGVMHQAELGDADWSRELDYLVRSGRAVVFPTLKSTFERRDGVRAAFPEPGQEQLWQERWVQWTQDVMRTLDYLETRDDMDMTRLGYLGFSWGGAASTFVLPVEKRFRAAVLVAGGITSIDLHDVAPETVLGRDPNAHRVLLSEVTIPIVIMNGKYDHLFPAEHTVAPFLESLGTPAT